MTVRCNRELLSRYKDGEVTPQERKQVEDHLLSCRDCAAVLASYRSIGKFIAGLNKLRAPGSLRSNLFAQIAQQESHSNRQRIFGSLLSGLALAGTAAFLIVILSMFFRNMNRSEDLVLATAVYPPQNASNVPPATTIEVQFNRSMDVKSVENSVLITPEMTATVALEGDKLVLKPVPSLAANTDYTVTISTKAKDAQGKPVKEPIVLHFTTGTEGVPTATATPTLAAGGNPISPTATITPGQATPTATATPSSTPTPAPIVVLPRLVVIDPKTPSTIFLGTSTGALYKSTNGGSSWRAVGSGLPTGPYTINSLIIDPSVGQLIYAATNQGAYKSSDGGENWYPIDNGLPTDSPSGKPIIQTLAMHPTNRLILYAGLSSDSASSTVYRSLDGGTSWSPLSNISPVAARPLAPDSLIFYPEAPATMFASTSSGMFESTDAGATWTAANKGLTESVYSLALQPKDYSSLFAVSQNGIYKTARGNIDWQKLSVNISSITLRTLNIAPDGTLYASGNRSDIGETRSLAIRSADGGNTWTQIQGGLENADPQSFTFDPANSRTIYAVTLAGIYKSTDGGSRWTQLTLNLPPTPTPQAELTITGVISEVSPSLLAAKVKSDDGDLWQVTLNQDPLQATQIMFGDGKLASISDLRPQSRVVAKGKVDSQAKPPAEKVLAARFITILSDRPAPTVTVVPPPFITVTARLGYVYDSAVGSSYNGDWLTHLRSRGFSVTPLDVRNEMGFDLDGYDLIVITWLSGQMPITNATKLESIKAPILNAYSPLVEKLGQGKVYDRGNPGQTSYGKTITIQDGGQSLTSGFTGEVTVANDTLYRVPIVTNGVVLATVTDDQMGVRNAPVWTLNERGVYFGFWYSNDGTNHNNAYWTFFDRSVDYLLSGFMELPVPTPTVNN